MALKRVMLGRYLARSQKRPSFERRAVYSFCISIHSLTHSASQSKGAPAPLYSEFSLPLSLSLPPSREQPFPITALNWFASSAAAAAAAIMHRVRSSCRGRPELWRGTEIRFIVRRARGRHCSLALLLTGWSLHRIRPGVQNHNQTLHPEATCSSFS